MILPTRRSVAAYAALVGLATTSLSCGSRTGLSSSEPRVDVDAEGNDALDFEDASSDGPPPCEAGTAEYAYALDDVGVLYRYDPVTGRKERMGAPDCGSAEAENVQWTMTATRDTAYIVYTDWTIYAVDLATLTCSTTAFQPGQLGLEGEFGVAVSGSGASARFFVYGIASGSSNPILAVADATSFVLTRVGEILPAPPAATFPVNLTAGADGHLYAFSPGGFLQEIDSATGRVIQSIDTGVQSKTTWATIAYGSDLYLWVGSIVVGYDVARRARTGELYVGVAAVGASSFLTCSGG